MSEANPAYAVGTIHESMKYGSFKVIEYRDSANVVVEFLNTGYITITTTSYIRRKNIRDKLAPTVHGIGYIGVGEFQSERKGVPSLVHRRWQSMLSRCYDASNKNYHNYGAKGVYVVEYWHNFQSYASWFHEQCKANGVDPETTDLQVDKDIEGYGFYSADSCVLVSVQENVEASKAKHYRFISPEGKLVEIYNLSKFCRENGLTRSGVWYVLSGRQSHHKGWTKAV